MQLYERMKNKHLVDARELLATEIAVEYNKVGSCMGYPLEPDERTIARLNASIAAINQELSSRGMARDGYTIVNDKLYDRHVASRSE